MTVRYGFRPIMMVGSLLYIAGLALMASANGLVSIMIGGGVLIGTSLACTAAAIAMSVAARAVPETVRSTVLGIVSAAGSLGALLSAPIGQLLNEGFGWRIGLAGFVRAVGADDPGGLVCRPGRQDSAAEACRRRHRRRHGASPRRRPRSAMRPSW